MAKPHPILPYEDPRALFPGLWQVRGSLPFPLKRNMTIVRLGDGTLLLDSVIAMHDDGMAKLEALGRPSIVIVPHGGHRMDAPFYKARYPDIRVVCPASVRAKVEQVITVDATCEETLPALGVKIHAVPGFRHGELGYEIDIPGGKALLLSDAVANSDYAPGFMGGLMARVTGGLSGRRLGVARIMRLTQIKDKAAARAGLSKLAEIPNLKAVVVAHGAPVLDDAAAALREAAGTI